MTPAQQPEHEWQEEDSGSSLHRDRFANLSTPWFTLIGEHIQTDNKVLDYWRIEKADSVIVLPVQADQLLLPPAVYRPGIGSETLDFPGGRCPKEQDPAEAAHQILERELGIDAAAIQSLMPLNQQGWVVNSSFSNQKLYGFIAQLDRCPVPHLGHAYSLSPEGMSSLLSELHCLQCRMVLLEWWYSHKTKPS